MKVCVSKCSDVGDSLLLQVPKYDKGIRVSVTRFGEISPIRPNRRYLWQYFEGSFSH